MAGIITINAHAIGRFGRSLRHAAPETIKTMDTGLRRVAEEAATAARGEASWSTRIPSSIRAGGTRGRAWVRAGGIKAPHAPAFENHGRDGQFRHPVFGNKEVWVDQKARPFLTPAVDTTVDANGELIAAAIADTIERMA